MYGKLLFVIPIYFQSLEVNTRTMELKREEYVQEGKNSPYLMSVAALIDHFNNYNWIPWQYTQIVGFIELT